MRAHASLRSTADMFEKSKTFSRFDQGSRRVLSVNLGHVPFIEEEADEGRTWKIALAIALAAHVVLFLVAVPESEVEAFRVGPKPKVYVVQQVRFNPPPPKAQQVMPKQRERKRTIPVPDPTPEEPEPIRVAEIEVPDLDLTTDDVIFGIPDSPPGTGVVGGPPMRLGDGIEPPVKIFYPQPKYTEEGRLSRIQGVVILEAIIDAVGDVHEVKVLKGLPMGLSEAAVEAAQQWKFRPATLDGKPVPVFLNLTIRFSLQ